MGKHRKKEPERSDGMSWRGQPVKVGSIIPGLTPSAFCAEKVDGGRQELYGRGQYMLTAQIVYIHPKIRHLTVHFDVTRRGVIVGRIRENYCIRGGRVLEE